MVKRSIAILLFLSFLLVPSIFYSQAVCDNEDFEASAAGLLTSSTSIVGYTAVKLNYTSPLLNNCTSFTSSAATPTNPQAIEVFSSSVIDPHIGPNYPIYSVFGAGAQNAGPTFNPQLVEMRGTNFIRVNSTSNALNYQFHMIEKTMTITASNALFKFAYIAVVETGGSSNCCDNPSVNYRFYNTSTANAELSCLSTNILPTTPFCPQTNGSSLIACPTYTNLFYNPWKVVAVDLSPYIGSVIKFKMGGFYCATGCSKRGYFYFDAQCGSMDVKVNNTVFPINTNSVSFVGCGISSATIVAPPYFNTYQWMGPSGFTSSLSTVTASQAGVYTLNINTAGTCSIITKFINIGLFPAATVTLTSSAPVLCKGKTAKIIASGLNTYTWNVASNSPTLNISPSATFTYIVNGSDNNGCQASATLVQTVISCVSITENDVKEMPELFPNPCTDWVNVRLVSAVPHELKIYDALGRLIQTNQIEQTTQKIMLLHRTPGVYYYSIAAPGSPLHIRKLIVAKE